MKRFFTLLFFLWIASPVKPQSSDISVHDPVMIKQDDLYYVFCTGTGISVFCSSDMINWTRQKPVFASAPEWVIKELPRFKNSMWAPDIIFHNGYYYLYYSVSAFGKNTSCIGVTRNKTLRQDSPDYSWEDLGCVIKSVPGRDHWNAIDPNFIQGDDGIPWLVFGSFWDGIKLVRLNDNLNSISEAPQEWYTLARRFRDPYTDDISAGSGQIEAPFLFRKGKFYYLFISWDKCCSGINSTYKVAVGRSEALTGPYLAKDSIDLAKGGGTIVVQGDERYPGVGHQAVVSFDGTDYLVYHGYDAQDNGRSKLLIRRIIWNDGWPTVSN